MPRVRDFNRKTVRVFPEGVSWPINEVTGFHVEMDEDVYWEAYYWPSGPTPVRIVFCKPHSLDNWEVVHRFSPGDATPPVFTWKPDNEDWFFCVEYQMLDGSWVSAPGDVSNAGGEIEAENNNNSVVMWWNCPQKTTLKLLAL